MRRKSVLHNPHCHEGGLAILHGMAQLILEANQVTFLGGKLCTKEAKLSASKWLKITALENKTKTKYFL